MNYDSIQVATRCKKSPFTRLSFLKQVCIKGDHLEKNPFSVQFQKSQWDPGECEVDGQHEKFSIGNFVKNEMAYSQHIEKSQKSYKFSKSQGTFVFGKIQCMLDTKTAETRWSSGYSELMFRHILCHHHYWQWHRPGVIRARMLVTQRQFCMTSSNDAKTNKSAQIRESKFSLMTR